MMLRAIFLTVIVLSPITSWANDEIKCNSGGNQLELTACALDDYTKADKELNQIYQTLINNERGDSVFIRKLRLAQKAWLAFRDAELEALFACSESNVKICWGSMYSMSFLSRKTDLTRERIRQLQDIVEHGRGE